MKKNIEKEFKEKSPSSSKEKSISKTRTRKRLRRAVKDEDEDIDLGNANSKCFILSNFQTQRILLNNNFIAKSKGETSEEYFEKFAHKGNNKNKISTIRKRTPKKSTSRKSTPKKQPQE